METTIRKVLECAICAPSGDNCQPWEFAVRGQSVELFNVPERDTSLYNFQQRASLVAHGALLENMRIAASALGLQAAIDLFPDPGQPNLVARIAFAASSPSEELLYPFIDRRATNRRPYRGGALSGEERQALLSVDDSVPGGQVHLAEELQQIAVLAKVVRLNDQLVFENRNLHDFLFDHIRWGDQEAEETRDGLDLKTLELSPFDRIGLKMLKSWSLVEKLNRAGLSKIASKQAEKLALSAATIGLVTVDGSDAASWLRCGQAMQRTWLEATRLGLGFQLMTGITFLIDRVLHGKGADLLPDQVERIAAAEASLNKIFDLETGRSAVLFRVGHSSAPSARSLRFALQQVVK